jgi:hypothetical protein
VSVTPLADDRLLEVERRSPKEVAKGLFRIV